MSAKLETIINSIAELTVLELSELIKALEDKFGVTAAAPMAFAAMPAAGGAAAADEDKEPTAFRVVLKDHGSQKIAVIKLVKDISGIGLKEAKEVVDALPKPLKEGVSKEEAEKMKAQLEEVGAVCEIVGM